MNPKNLRLPLVLFSAMFGVGLVISPMGLPNRLGQPQCTRSICLPI